MSTPRPLPLRVLVKGASTVVWTSFMGGPRTDLGWPRALEAELLRMGIEAEVRNTAVLGTPSDHWFETFEQDLSQWSPDVVIAVPSHYESLHAFLPHAVERWANRVNRPPAHRYDALRKRIRRGTYRALIKVQARCDRALPESSDRRRMRRAAAVLEGYVQLAQFVASPHVIVLELLRPAEKIDRWLPGCDRRIQMANEENRAMVGRLGLDNVQMFATTDVAHAMYGEGRNVATPDGFHYTPELHQAIATALAQDVAAIAKTLPHLANDGRPDQVG